MSKVRHIKTRRKNTWTRLRKEIEQCTIRLGLSKEAFAPVNLYEWQAIEQKIWDTFSSSKHARWIWENLSVPYSATSINNEDLPIKNLIDPSERAYFLFNETVNESTKFWIYEGCIAAFEQLYMEANGMDEFIIVSKQYDWLLTLNHHQILIGTGLLKDKIDVLKQSF